MKKLVKYTLGGVLFILLVIGFSYQQALRQLYNTIHLFDADRIVENFSSMETMAPTKALISSGPVRTLTPKPAELPDTFKYKDKIISMDEWLKDSSATALVVVKGENLVFEDYYQGTQALDKRISWSMAKSYLSALFGIAVGEGKIPDINAAVTDYVPNLKGTGYDNVTIKNVLQMSSGVYFNEDYGDFNSDINRFGRIMALGGSFDDFAATLKQDPKHEQGTYMHYVSIDTHVIGMVLRAATGTPIMDYMQEKLWRKLGNESDAYYITDTTGEPMVLGGLNIISRDYARMGMLYRDHGQYNGEQIVPKQWVEDSITADAAHLVPGLRDSASTNFGYGYQWWIPENPNGEFLALGIYGQYIYINRPKNVVIVKNSAHLGFMDNHYASKDIAVAAFREIANSLR